MISLNLTAETNISLNNYILNSISLFKYTPKELHKYVIGKCNENPLIYIKDEQHLPDQSAVCSGNDILEEITDHFNYTLKSSDKKIMDVILGSLSPKGFLESSDEEIAALTNAGPSNVKLLIAALKDYGSKGVGCTDAVDFIKFQLKTNDTYDEALFSAFKDNLHDIQTGSLKFLSFLDIDPDDFHSYVENEIKRCSLYPLDGDEQIDILPEGSISVVQDRLQIQIEDYLAEDIVFEPLYLTGEETDFSNQIKTYREEYSELVSMLKARKIYLLKILHVICDIQKNYMTGDADYLHSLDQSRLAELTGLSAATVSRLISNKYISTPRGILPIQSLLSKECCKGFSVSQVKYIIRNINGYATLSDNKISVILNELGIKISRRTVNKYKNQILGK